MSPPGAQLCRRGARRERVQAERVQSGACLECQAGHRPVLQQVLDRAFVALRGGAVQRGAAARVARVHLRRFQLTHRMCMAPCWSSAVT
jgi:hypothetical protein